MTFESMSAAKVKLLNGFHSHATKTRKVVASTTRPGGEGFICVHSITFLSL